VESRAPSANRAAPAPAAVHWVPSNARVCAWTRHRTSATAELAACCVLEAPLARVARALVRSATRTAPANASTPKRATPTAGDAGSHANSRNTAPAVRAGSSTTDEVARRRPSARELGELLGTAEVTAPRGAGSPPKSEHGSRRPTDIRRVRRLDTVRFRAAQTRASSRSGTTAKERQASNSN